MHKQQRLIGMLIVIALAVGLGIINERSGGADGGSSSVQSSRATRPTAQTGEQAERTATPRRSATRTAPAPTPRREAAEQSDSLPTIAFGELPPEAQDTIELIERGGPFPYDKDGSLFRNRERLLPQRPDGYYREYTVETPGEDDRGARRIVAGRGGELYYTDDHYDSFSRVQ